VSGVDLVQWLRDQLDIDAARATAAAEEDGPDWRYDGHAVITRREGDLVAVGSQDFMESERGAFIAAHDPSRVLQEIEAKRDLLRLAERAHDYHGTFTNGFASALEETLRLFALAYADRPGYREEWRP
jgi:hypothetical protein